jgi:2-oxoglutarate ferredoxin oxidoreductase subunit gamma
MDVALITGIQVEEQISGDRHRTAAIHLDVVVIASGNEEGTVAPYGCGTCCHGPVRIVASALGEHHIVRGGTANVIVIISSERISSPVIKHFDSAIILNQQSLDKFENSVKPGGVLVYDGNGITRHPERKDISIYRVDAAEEASKMDSPKIFNTIVLGGFLKVKPIIKLENVIKGLKKSLPERYHNLIPINELALQRGTEIIQEIYKA